MVKTTAQKTAARAKAQQAEKDYWDKIAASVVKSKGKSWARPWEMYGGDMPQNAASGYAYQGANVWRIIAAMEEFQLVKPHWVPTRGMLSECKKQGWETTPFKEFQHLTVGLRKPAFFVQDKSSESTDDKKGRFIPGSTFYVVSVEHMANICPQYHEWISKKIDAREAKFAKKTEGLSPNQEKLVALFESIVADSQDVEDLTIKLGGNRAFCQGDLVQVPQLVAFNSPESAMMTLIHELTHWTGDAKRLKRDKSGKFGSELYAREELVAEGSALLTALALGITSGESTNHEGNSIEYLANWLGALPEQERGMCLKEAHNKVKAARKTLLKLFPGLKGERNSK